MTSSFNINDVNAGDILVIKGIHREWARRAVVSVEGPLLKCIILYDASHRDWVGTLVTFSKAEFNNSQWRKLVSSAT